MAKSSSSNAATRKTVLRLTVWGLLACTVLGAVIYGAQQFEQFLISDRRFVLPVPVDYGQESPNLRIRGVHYASRKQVLRIFDNDLGRSVYLLPLKDRQRALLRIGWIKEASIVRFWPNRLFVEVKERSPAAFVEMKTEGISRWALIDSDGIILEPPERAVFHLPVLSGVRFDERQNMRGMRVRRMLALMKELGPLDENISEIDVSDLDDLKVTQQMQDHAIVLMLGDRNFRSRFQHFADHYPDIRKRMPNATVLDLRLDDRITVVQEKRRDS